MTRSDWLMFGERLRRQRNGLGFTQEYIAENAALSLRYYQMLEQGHCGTSVETLVKLSRLLSVSIDYLLFGEAAYPMSPLGAAIGNLTPEQQADAVQLLTIYVRACTQENSP